MSTTANSKQVGGQHYKTPIQHWDFVQANDLDYFQGQITKYVCRWKRKNGVQDLRKAQHFLEKYIELAEEQDKQSAKLSEADHARSIGTSRADSTALRTEEKYKDITGG